MSKKQVARITIVIRDTLLAIIAVLIAVIGLLRNFQESTKLTVVAVVITILVFVVAVSAYIYFSKTSQKRHQYSRTERNWALGALGLTLLITLGALLVKDVRTYVLAAFERAPSNCPYRGVATGDDKAIEWLIKQEAKAVVAERRDWIQDIFSPSALIVDYGDKNNPIEYDDPYAHYDDLFNRAHYNTAVNDNIRMLVIDKEGTAYYTSASHGDGTGSDGAPFQYINPDNANHWIAKKIDGCWKIVEFDFNASNIPFPVGVEVQ